VAAILGHQDIRTTKRYWHPEKCLGEVVESLDGEMMTNPNSAREGSSERISLDSDGGYRASPFGGIILFYSC
jgi:hypothetical protein